MQEQYREPGDEDADISFVKKIQIREGLYPSGESGSIRPLEEIEEILNKEERGKKMYTVIEGDTPIIIAAKNGISLELSLIHIYAALLFLILHIRLRGFPGYSAP